MSYSKQEAPFCHLSTRIHHGMHKILGRKMAPCAMGLRQARILMTLVDRGEVGQRELYDMFQIDRAVVTKSLNILEEDGYVVRERHPKDKRRYVLRPTAQGVQAVPVIEDAWRQTEAVLTRGLSGEEKDSALALLLQIRDNVEQELNTMGMES